jgi:hypothetical protein
VISVAVTRFTGSSPVGKRHSAANYTLGKEVWIKQGDDHREESGHRHFQQDS